MMNTRALKNEISKKYLKYDLKYYFTPGKWMNDQDLARVIHAMEYVNRTSGRNLDYGIFDSNYDAAEKREFLRKANLCVMRLKGEPVGFFFNLVLQEKPFPTIHAGLVMIAKNAGVDLLAIPYVHMAIMQYQRFGRYFYTNISSTPSIIGIFTSLFTDVWPSEKANLLKPPSRAYRQVAELLFREYAQKYFPNDQVELDIKRFVMRSPVQDMGFETNPRKLPRYKDLRTNLFCNYWLDYSRGEDMIQVGKVDLRFFLKGTLILMATRFMQLKQSLSYARAKEVSSERAISTPKTARVSVAVKQDELIDIIQPQAGSVVSAEKAIL